MVRISCETKDTLRLEELTDFQGDLKTRTEEQVQKIINSIEKYGFSFPFFVWNHDSINHVLDGHGRMVALRKMQGNGEEIPPLPIVYIDCKDEADAKNLLLRINSQYGEVDQEALIKFMDGIEVDWNEIEIPGARFDFMEDEEIVSVEGDDEIPEPPEEPFSQQGDKWILGENILVCGDSTVAATYDLLLGDDKATLLITDPPYNVNYTGGTKDRLTIENDNLSSEEFYKFLSSVFGNIRNRLIEGSSFYVWFASKESINFRKAMEESDFIIKQELVWVKDHLVLGRQDYQWRHEPCLYGWIPGRGHYFTDDRSQTTVLEFDKPQKSDLHPTMKPVALFELLIQNSSKSNDIVLDTFSGSGTTIIACERLNRKARCIEFDPHYADVIVRRWMDITGRSDVVCIRNGEKINIESFLENN